MSEQSSEAKEENFHTLECLQVKDEGELGVLADKQAHYQDLVFSFSPDYLARLAELLQAPHAFQVIGRAEHEFAGYIAAAKLTNNTLIVK